MPLTVTQQLNILNEQDDFVFPGEFNLQTTVTQAAVAWITEFLQTYKDGSEQTAYFQKMSSTGQRSFNRPGRGEARFTEVMVGQIALQPFDYATVKGATLPQWEDFIADNMDDVIEIYAGVTKEEKAEYEALP